MDHEKYGLQLDIEQIRLVEERDRAEGFSEYDFVEHSRHDADQMARELEALAGEIADEGLRILVRKLLNENAATLRVLPGSVGHYYPFVGGWLEHTLNVTRTSSLLAERYSLQFPNLAPPLNRDLIVAGAILHDIGRVRDLESGVPGQPARRGVDGMLFGHLFLAYDLIRGAAQGVGELHPELLDLLLHIVITHLRLPEWGSRKQSCIPEALIIHHAVELDAEFEIASRCLMNDAGDGPLTERDPILRMTLLKQRKV
jgi:3'-5' exoribonuclease